IQPILDAYCVKCHSSDKPKGDLSLEHLNGDLSPGPERQRWEKVIEQLNEGTMPPKSKPRPPAADVTFLVKWATTEMTNADITTQALQGRVVLRRLNRAEYENTVSDLLGVQVNLKDLLPLDTSAGGFDNVGEALHTSSFLLACYLEAAETALDQAIANRPQPLSSKKRYLLTESHQVKRTTEKVFRTSEEGEVVLFTSSAWQAVGLTPFYPSERGRYRFRISASAVQSSGKPVTFRVTSGAGGMGGPKAHLVGYFDAPADTPKVIEFIDFMEPKTSISILPYGLPSAQAINKIGAQTYDGPGVAVQWVEVEGPLHDAWPPESHRRIFNDLTQVPAPIYRARDRVEVTSANPAEEAKRILTAFMRRAFRRPVRDAEVQAFVSLVEAKLAEKHSFEQAVRVGLAAVMTSPQFLFLREEPGKLNAFALASRLSYFLWSTMPDEELLALAEKGTLTNPDVLRAQVDRMLSHPKASAFTTNFVGQWLGLRDIDFTMPSHILYPEFDDMLKASMVKETELFFDELLKKDLSIANFIASDFTLLNGRLAKHYGIPGVDGWEFRKVSLPKDSHRGGVMTMASVLKVTANGTTTSPILRGAWVLDRVLGTPPPKPPENVAALEPDIRGATTMREQLAKHRQIESCASCHVKIDPPGFALENFDVIGGWRDFYRTSGNGKPVTLDGRKMPYLHGHAVDAADVLPDGRKFVNVDELKKLLLADMDTFTRALTTRLITYGTGGTPTMADRKEIDAIVQRAQEKGYGFRTLMHEVVTSTLFTSK
ncbi:MAG TPA: DUF1592 domain-containing protein, partial [Candidatus Saccharimonadia bacterium]|nr:DUF1592 domain-containing protein [Candidatus Saccharimonadia bacterium]